MLQFRKKYKKDYCEDQSMNTVEDKVLKNQCTGCAACYNKCPVNAIEMKYNDEGFLFPQVDYGKCVECGLCWKVCPELNLDSVKQRIHPEGTCYAAMAEDALREVSSSGGMFTLLANEIYQNGGVVCGAVYREDYKEVYHIVSRSPEDLGKLRGSKYVQSAIGDVYSIIKSELTAGKPVLFVGCPCQVSGLYSYLGKEYEKLYTADLICHGANSVYAYQSYIEEVANGRKITEVNFRDKSVFGWSTPVTIHFEDGSVYNAAWNKNKWNEAFLGGIINRECCGCCHYAQRKRIGDITLGDFWQVHKWDAACNDWKGTSLVLVNSEQGQKLFEQVRTRLKVCKEAPFDFAVQNNGQLAHPNKMAPGRRFFFHHLKKDGYHKALWYGHRWRYDVGLVGWWFSANYGSVLTYYALAKILEDMDMLAIMVRIPKMDGRPWEAETDQNVKFMEKYFMVTKPRKFEEMQECNQFCDAFMLGSDQLWVHTYNQLVGYSFYLDFADANKKKIAYATSLGYAEYKGSPEDREIVKLLLNRFDGISVREVSGVDICRNEFGVEAVRMLDPVFLCDRKHYDALADNAGEIRKDPYILCYILDPTEEKRQAIRILEKKLGMASLVVLDMKSFYECRKIWNGENIADRVGIEEFVSYIRNCAFLFTDSHHGVCFGMIYQKPFAAVANPRRGRTRFDSLFQVFEMTDLLLEEGNLCESLDVLKDPDYERINTILDEEKKRSLQWLQEQLQKEKKDEGSTSNLFAKYFNLAKRLEVEKENMKKIENV